MKDSLRRVQQTELDILEVVHNICVENNLKYSIAYGTLIGAVRHHGFIPWDDDIDICMPREDYERFIKIWPSYQFDGYILQNLDTDEDFTQNFTKIRKKNTTFFQKGEEKYKYNKRIFIYIFPGDRVPNSSIKRKIQYVYMAVNLLYSRKFKSRSSNKIISLIENILFLMPKSKYRKYAKIAEKHIKKYNRNGKLNYVFASTLDTTKKYYPNDIFVNRVLLEFEGKQFYAYKEYDQCLRIEYGDYMQLPPKEERVWKHTPQLIDFEHEYTELLSK